MAYGIGEVRGMRDIGKNIRTLRERRGLTQEELAQALFVTRQTVSNYETGKSRPDIDMLMKIAQVLETDVDQVLYGPRPVEDRRREIWRLIAALGGMAVLVLLWALLGPVTVRLLKKGIGFPQMILSSVARPAWWLLLGWCVFQGLWLLKLIRPLKDVPWVEHARKGMLVLLGITVVLLLPMLVYLGWQMIVYLTWDRSSALSFEGISHIWAGMVIFNVRYSEVYAAVGGALWLFHFPKC